MKKKIFVIVLFLSLFLLQTQAYAEDTTYTDEKYGFSITYPSNYRTFKNFKGASITIFFPITGFFNLFNGYVSVSGQSVKPTTRPIEELIDIQFKYSKSVQKKENVIINGIKFLSVVQSRKMAFWKLKLHHLITVKGTRVYTITYANTAKNYDTCRGAFQISSNSRSSNCCH